MPPSHESDIEVVAPGWLDGLGYDICHGSDIVPDELRVKKVEEMVEGV